MDFSPSNDVMIKIVAKLRHDNILRRRNSPECSRY
jgi:hypothetical protein